MNLINIGERPLFAALPLLEEAYRLQKINKSAYLSTSQKKNIHYAVGMFVLARVLESRHRRDEKENLDLFKILVQYPLFFTVEQARKWETDKFWTNFIQYKPYLMEYENGMESQAPSLSYQINTPAKVHVWQKWFELTPLPEIIETLEFSSKKIFSWEKENDLKDILVSNLQVIGEKLQLSQENIEAWTTFHLLSQGNWDFYLKEKEADIESVKGLFSLWEQALNMKDGFINSILLPDSQLVELGLLKTWHKADIQQFKWHDIKEELISSHLPNLNIEYLKKDNILNLFLTPTGKSVIPLSFWSYLHNFENIVHALKKNLPMKILIHGQTGIGKSEFIHSLTKELQIDAYEPIYAKKKQYLNDKEVSDYEAQIHLANNLVSKIKRGALVIDNIESKLNITDNIDFIKDINHTQQFWIMSDLQKVSKHIFNQFDLVIEIQEPPLEFRNKLCSSLFKDKNIALRIAQTIKIPMQIIQIYNWCKSSEDWSWKNISGLLASISKAQLYNESESLNINKVEAPKEIVKLSGNEVLENLLKKLIYFFKNPNDYKEMGAQAAKGVLLVGPPGVGKTHFARNLSKIVDIPMFAPDTSVLANNIASINAIFSEIKKQAPCILFLDEIDTLISSPKEMFSIDLNKQKVVNTFLSNMDGIDSNDGVLIIGATHRFDNIEPAAVRSGRLSEVIQISKPNEISRQAIWKIHLEKKKTENINLSILSQASAGFSGADIAEASNKAAVLAVENYQSAIVMDNLLQACDDVFWGQVDGSKLINPRQRELIAYHEAGHALLAWKNNYIVQRITIRPRETMLGAVHFVHEEGIYNSNMPTIRSRVQITLGGIAAEKVIFGHYENGGVGDLEHAHKLVTHALCNAGLGQSGPVHLGDNATWSNERKFLIENEEKKLMEEEFEHTQNWLMEQKELLIELAQYLLDKKEISGSILDYFKEKVEQTQPKTLFVSKSPEIRVLHQENNI